VLIDREQKAVTPKKKYSLKDLVVRSLPRTTEGLYELARREHHSLRPEAAIRQTIRNLKKRGVVAENERGEIYLVENALG